MDQQQLAFQQFMLGGGGGKKTKDDLSGGGARNATTPASSKKNKKKKSGRGSSQGVESFPAPSMTSSSSSQKKRRKKKQVDPILKVIQSKVQEWKDMDDQIEAVIDSIANLRFRIWCESCRIIQQKYGSHDGTRKKEEWKQYGLRCSSYNVGGRCGSSGDYLLLEDVELALNYDLLQHERMVAGVRQLMSALGQIFESIGRRLDEWMRIECEEGYSEYGDDWGGGGAIGGEGLQLMVQDVYQFLSDELYRKQMLVKNILDTCHDGLIQNDHGEERKVSGALDTSLQNSGSSSSDTPRVVARRSHSQWRLHDGRDSNEGLVMDKLLKIGRSMPE